MSQTATWVCAVSVATIWTSPESVREIDTYGTAEAVNMNKWLEAMNEENRKDLVNSSRVQTQLLYGEPVIVEEQRDGWAKVIAVWQPSVKDERGYPGWVPLHQLKQIEAYGLELVARVKKDKAQLWTEDGLPLGVVPFNAVLPAEGAGNYWRLQTPDGEAFIRKEDVDVAPSLDELPKGSGEDVTQLGATFLDLPYFWGGMSSYGYDCSGFSYNMLKANGVFIPRDASDQAREGIEVPTDDPSQWQPGDLLFFAYEEGKGRLHHVGIYYGNGLMIHSPTPGKAVEIIELKGTVHEKELCAVRRYAQKAG